MKFTSKHNGNDVDIHNLAKRLGVDCDYNTSSVAATVSFQIEIESRDRGIKSISAIVTKVEFSFNWEVDVEELLSGEKEILIEAGGTEYRNNTIGGEISTSTDDSWDIISELKFSPDGQLMVDAVAIDLHDRTILIQ
jgi:hypothetical protein